MLHRFSGFFARGRRPGLASGRRFSPATVCQKPATCSRQGRRSLECIWQVDRTGRLQCRWVLVQTSGTPAIEADPDHLPRSSLPRRPMSCKRQLWSTWKHTRGLLHDGHITMPFRANLAYSSQQLRIICNNGGMAPLDAAFHRRNGVKPGNEIVRLISSQAARRQSALMTKETARMFVLEKFTR
jgi:hypothetical protein